MMKHLHAPLACSLAIGAYLLAAGCENPDGPPPPPGPPVCLDSIQVRVDIDSVPVFSWSPNCTLGRLLVEQGIDEYWGTEAAGVDIYQSPIRYGDRPPGSTSEEPAIPLTPGQSYRVTLYHWITYTPAFESLQVLDTQEFLFLPTVPKSTP